MGVSAASALWSPSLQARSNRLTSSEFGAPICASSSICRSSLIIYESFSLPRLAVQGRFSAYLMWRHYEDDFEFDSGGHPARHGRSSTNTLGVALRASAGTAFWRGNSFGENPQTGCEQPGG